MKLNRVIHIHDTPTKTPVPEQLRQAIQNAGIKPPQSVYIDGNIHRFSTGDSHDDAGWYVVFPEGDIQAGSFGCWRQGVTHNFIEDIGRALTPIEQQEYRQRIAEAQKKREEAEAIKHQQTADTCLEIWNKAAAADEEHPYLMRKQIMTHGARISGAGALMIPLFDENHQLSTVQYIYGNGEKKYHPGGKTKGCFHALKSIDDNKKVYIAEGFATAATVYEFTDSPTIAAFSAYNLVNVAEIIRKNHKTIEIVIVADNDESGVGKSYADQAAAKYGCKIVIPPSPGDVNDYAVSGGSLDDLFKPKKQDWLIHISEFLKQPEPIQWMIKKWLPKESLIMIHGPSGSGKTFCILDMALSISTGLKEWEGYKVRKGNVIYLAGEGHKGLRGRVAGWCQERGIKSPGSIMFSKSGCNLNESEGFLHAVQNIRDAQIKPDLIIIDTLHRFLMGDENSAQDAKTMLDACASLTNEFSCSVVLVHHTGLSEGAQSRARGSSAWRGALDIEINVTPQDKKTHTPMIFQQMKNKDDELTTPLHFVLEKTPVNGWKDEDNEQIYTAILKAAEAPKSIEEQKISQEFHIFKEAWRLNSGEYDEKIRPYISRQALKNHLIDVEKKTESAAKKAIQKADGRWIYKLLEAGLIVEFLHGFSVINTEKICQFQLIKPPENKPEKDLEIY